METTAKIVSVQENQRQWDYQGSTFYDHLIKYEGSDKTWTYASKSAVCEKFKAGQPATFETQTGTNKAGYEFFKIKPAQANGAGGFKGQPKDEALIAAQSCLGYACNLHSQSSKATDTAYILSVAQEFHNWVMTKKTK